MKKNKSSNHDRSHGGRRSSNELSMSAMLLVLAILFFLLGLAVWAKASGYSFFDGMSSNGNGLGRNGGTTTNGTGGSRVNGGNGGNGSNGTGTGNGNGSSLDDLDVNVKTDNGLQLDAGLEDGQLYVNPDLNPDAQGGLGGEANLNDDKVLDTDDILR